MVIHGGGYLNHEIPHAETQSIGFRVEDCGV